MATTVQGRRQYDTQSSRIIPNVMKSILLIDADPNTAGFLTFFNKCKKETTPQEKFTWDVDTYLDLTDTTAAAATASATAVDVTTPGRWLPGQLWVNNRTGEIVYVSAINTSTSQVTLVRGVTALNSSGGTAAAAMNSGDTLVRLGPIVGEDNTRQTTQTTTPTEVYNYSQVFRWDLSMSRRQIKREYETGDELPYQVKKQLNEARKQLNATFIDGERARFTLNGVDYTSTKGIRTVPSTYTYDAGGVLYETQLDDFLISEGMRTGSRNKMLFCSADVLAAFVEMGKERLHYDLVKITSAQGSMGIRVVEYMAGNGGNLMLVEDRYLTEARAGVAIGVDMDQIVRKVFSGNGYDDDLHYITDTQDKDDLGYVTTLTGDMGLQYGAEQCHFLITNVSGGATGSSLQ